MNDLSLYIHIPFCVRKCPYCDFYSVDTAKMMQYDMNIMLKNNENLVKKQGEIVKTDLKTQFLDAICEEICEKSKNFAEKAVKTIYFGGGTPSFLDFEHINRIFEEIKDNFSLDFGDLELTLEANPGTLSIEKLKNLKNMGINRISLGIQSLNDDVLRTLGRIHDREGAISAYEMAREAGFDNISIDLMFAIPGQTHEAWIDTVKEAIELNPEHISMYSLEFMEGTKFDIMRTSGEMKETSEESDRKMYDEAIELLESAGYIQYEISNFAKPGYESKHNLGYWDLSEYIGFGPSAHSYYDHKRYSNPRDIEKYIENPLESEMYEDNTPDDDMSEYTFTGLRKADGISFNKFMEKFGKNFWEYFGEKAHAEFNEFVKTGHALDTPEGIKLTKKGFSISNRIMNIFV